MYPPPQGGRPRQGGPVNPNLVNPVISVHPAAAANAVTWVADPPGPQRSRAARRAPYAGPPAYPAPPRWGFPQLTWRRPTSVPGAAGPGAGQGVRFAARAASSSLALLLIAALLAVFGEVWRYVLLARSLTEQLTAGTLVSSDVWVNTASVLTVILAIVSAIAVLVWVYRAQRAAAARTGVDPARPDWQLLGVLVPVVNLVLPFSVLAELEQAALGERRGRPRPSGLLRAWWAAWLLGALCFLAELFWPLRGSSMQALADGVLLHAFTDLVAAALATLTLLLLRRITGLLELSTTERRMRRAVVRSAGGDSLERRDRPVGATR